MKLIQQRRKLAVEIVVFQIVGELFTVGLLGHKDQHTPDYSQTTQCRLVQQHTTITLQMTQCHTIQTRHRVSTSMSSMYSLTFCVRVMLP